MKIAIITANFGGYEELKPAMPQDGCEARFICVTDDLKQEPNGWELVSPLISHEDPNLSGKHPKCMPWIYTTALCSVWVDASFRIVSRTMAVDLIERAHPIAQFAHPERDCIFEEAESSAQMERYRALPLAKQAEAYRRSGHPKHWGLWACGVIAADLRQSAVRGAFADWYNECLGWGVQDQVSQAYCLRAAGVRPASLPDSLYNNRWFRFEPSQRHQEARR